MPYYAHSGNDQSPARKDWQLLRDHLLAVATGAELRASPIRLLGRSLGPAAYATGLFHDLGKYRFGFRKLIEGIPVPDKSSTYHKHAGAAKAWDNKQYGAAFAIAGHHGGLPSLGDLKHAANNSPAGRAAIGEFWAEAIADLSALDDLVWTPTQVKDPLLFDLETRILFSCLVDADWSDTAEHDRRVKGWPEEPAPPTLTKDLAERWLGGVLETIREKAGLYMTAEVRQAREAVLNAALVAADSPTGFFTLEVPTGGGKTLSGLAFALKHAARHGLRRVIYVAPYLSILDQNAGVIRDAIRVGEEGQEVFEHHSLKEPFADTEEGDEQREGPRAAAARRAENWDAPVIITTNVQFLESLFSREPGRCRKVHNIAHSVVILDECQAIPNGLLAPTCSMLDQLVEHLGCSIVLATATQPTFDHPALRERSSGLRNVRPILPRDGPSGIDLFTRLRRVRAEWPRPGEFLDWDDLARLMTENRHDQRPAALCVVNTRRAARELYRSLEQALGRDEIYHLSTWMCPAHRSIVLHEVRRRLRSGLPCYLVSTQLIEAGVDVDFPLVLRELAPLEAVIQTAGRCNREGLLNGPDGSPGGRVIIFRSRAAHDQPERYYPPDPWYQSGREVLENHFLGNDRHFSIDDPQILDEYFHRLLNTGELDARQIRKDREGWNFPEASRKYRLIDESGEPVVAANWKEHADRIAELIDAVRERPSRSRFRALNPYQVNLRFASDRQRSFVEEDPIGLSIWRGGYHSEMGLWDELLADETVFW
jgi:CRISPR-associated endonuclease/helicase Cas3